MAVRTDLVQKYGAPSFVTGNVPSATETAPVALATNNQSYLSKVLQNVTGIGGEYQMPDNAKDVKLSEALRFNVSPESGTAANVAKTIANVSTYPARKVLDAGKFLFGSGASEVGQDVGELAASGMSDVKGAEASTQMLQTMQSRLAQKIAEMKKEGRDTTALVELYKDNQKYGYDVLKEMETLQKSGTQIAGDFGQLAVDVASASSMAKNTAAPLSAKSLSYGVPRAFGLGSAKAVTKSLSEGQTDVAEISKAGLKGGGISALFQGGFNFLSDSGKLIYPYVKKGFKQMLGTGLGSNEKAIQSLDDNPNTIDYIRRGSKDKEGLAKETVGVIDETINDLKKKNSVEYGKKVQSLNDFLFNNSRNDYASNIKVESVLTDRADELATEQFDDLVREVGWYGKPYGEIPYSRVVSEWDPIAYREGVLDWADLNGIDIDGIDLTDINAQFDEYLDELGSSLTMDDVIKNPDIYPDPADVVKEIDPIMYKTSLSDYSSSIQEDLAYKLQNEGIDSLDDATKMAVSDVVALDDGVVNPDPKKLMSDIAGIKDKAMTAVNAKTTDAGYSLVGSDVYTAQGRKSIEGINERLATTLENQSLDSIDSFDKFLGETRYKLSKAGDDTGLYTYVSSMQKALREAVDSQTGGDYSLMKKAYSEGLDDFQQTFKALFTKDGYTQDVWNKAVRLMNDNQFLNRSFLEEVAPDKASDIMARIAGVQLGEVLPTGALRRLMLTAGGTGLLLTGNVPAFGSLAVSTSPRAVSELYNLLNLASKEVGQIADTLPMEELSDALRGKFSSWLFRTIGEYNASVPADEKLNADVIIKDSATGNADWYNNLDEQLK